MYSSSYKPQAYNAMPGMLPTPTSYGPPPSQYQSQPMSGGGAGVYGAAPVGGMAPQTSTPMAPSGGYLGQSYQNQQIQQSPWASGDKSNTSGSEPQPDPDMYETCVYLGIDDGDGFDFRTRVIGEKGENLDYMRRSTGAKVLLRGKGSGVYNNRPPHIFISHSTLQGMTDAEKLATNLVNVIKEDYQEFKGKRGLSSSDGMGKQSSQSGLSSSDGMGKQSSQKEQIQSQSRSQNSIVMDYGHSRSNPSNVGRGQNGSRFDYDEGPMGVSRGGGGGGYSQNERSSQQQQMMQQQQHQQQQHNQQQQNNQQQQHNQQQQQHHQQQQQQQQHHQQQQQHHQQQQQHHQQQQHQLQQQRGENRRPVGYNDDSQNRRGFSNEQQPDRYSGGRNEPSRNDQYSSKPQQGGGFFCDLCNVHCPNQQMYTLHCKGVMHTDKTDQHRRRQQYGREPPRQSHSMSEDMGGTHWEGPPDNQDMEQSWHGFSGQSEYIEDYLFNQCERLLKTMIANTTLRNLKRSVEKIGQRDLKSAIPNKPQSQYYCKLCKEDVPNMQQHLGVKAHGNLYLLRQIQLGDLFMDYYSDVPIPGVITNGGRVLAMDTLTFGPCIPETNRERFKELLVYSGAYLAYKCSVCVTNIATLGNWVQHITSKKHGKRCIEVMLQNGIKYFMAKNPHIPIPPPRNALEIINGMEITYIHPTMPQLRRSPNVESGSSDRGQVSGHPAAGQEGMPLLDGSHSAEYWDGSGEENESVYLDPFLSDLPEDDPEPDSANDLSWPCDDPFISAGNGGIEITSTNAASTNVNVQVNNIQNVIPQVDSLSQMSCPNSVGGVNVQTEVRPNPNIRFTEPKQATGLATANIALAAPTPHAKAAQAHLAAKKTETPVSTSKLTAAQLAAAAKVRASQINTPAQVAAAVTARLASQKIGMMGGPPLPGMVPQAAASMSQVYQGVTLNKGPCGPAAYQGVPLNIGPTGAAAFRGVPLNKGPFAPGAYQGLPLNAGPRGASSGIMMQIRQTYVMSMGVSVHPYLMGMHPPQAGMMGQPIIRPQFPRPGPSMPR